MSTEYVTGLKSTGLAEWKRLPLHGAFIWPIISSIIWPAWLNG